MGPVVATAVKSPTHRAAAKPAPVKIDTPTAWAVLVLVEMNKQLRASGKAPIPITVQNVETILRPISGEGTVGQQGGFLRDNNPWNVGTYCGAHGPSYGAIKTIAPYGVDQRCVAAGAVPPYVYLNIFATPEAGAKGTAAYLLQFSNYGAMRLNAPASNVLQGTTYTGEAGFAPAANPTQAQVTSLATRLGSASIPVPLAAPANATLTATQAKNARQWFQQLAPEYKAATGKTLAIPSLMTLEGQTTDQVVAEIQAVFRPIQAGTTNAVPSRTLILATIGNPGSAAGAATPESDNPVSALSAAVSALVSAFSGAASWVAELTKLLGELTSAAFWKRVGVFALGGALVIGGIVVFLQSTKPVQAAEGAVAHA